MTRLRWHTLDVGSPAVHAEEFRPAGEVLRAEVFARLMAGLSR
ncbi:hypothetical protein ACWDRB_62795 [Nonomuraea sp. NPDC003707]